MNLKLLLATTVTCCMWQASMATTPGVAIIKADGTQHTVEFAALHRIDIGETAVTVHHTTAEPTTHNMADIERIDIGTDVSGIADITARGEIAVWPTVATDVVNVAGAKADAAVKLFDLNGRCVASAQTDNSGAASLNVAALTPGAYVLGVANHTVKIIKK